MKTTPETEIMLAALAVRLELPTDVDLLHRGLTGLRYRPTTTVREAADRILADYRSGELAQRLAAH